MNILNRITETIRREAAKPENQHRVRQLLEKFRGRNQQPPAR